MDSAYFLETLAGNFMNVVQYNEDNRGFEVRGKPNCIGGKEPDMWLLECFLISSVQK